MKSISFIVPAYNEEKTINSVLEKLAELDLGLDKEILVIDDGSGDATGEVVRKLQKRYDSIRLLTHIKNSGKGSAIQTGFKEASGDIIAIQDADLEYNVNDFKRLVRPIIDGKAKVVYGSRFLKKNDKGYGMFYFGNRFLSLATSVLYFKKITDMETCYKLLEKSVAKRIKICNRGFAVEPEITAKILNMGYKIIELPVDYSPRSKEEGKKIRLSDGFKALATLVKYRFSL